MSRPSFAHASVAVGTSQDHFIARDLVRLGTETADELEARLGVLLEPDSHRESGLTILPLV